MKRSLPHDGPDAISRPPPFIRIFLNRPNGRQPRDCDNRACVVVYDSDARVVEYHRVPYDIETSAQKIFDADLALIFGKRLFLGV